MFCNAERSVLEDGLRTERGSLQAVKCRIRKEESEGGNVCLGTLGRCELEITREKRCREHAFPCGRHQEHPGCIGRELLEIRISVWRTSVGQTSIIPYLSAPELLRLMLPDREVKYFQRFGDSASVSQLSIRTTDILRPQTIGPPSDSPFEKPRGGHGLLAFHRVPSPKRSFSGRHCNLTA